MPPLVEELSPEEAALLEADKNAPPADTAAETGTQAEADPPEAAAETPAKPQMVPHAALHEERVKRQETERQLAEERRARQTLDERTNLILQRFAQPQAPAQPGAPQIPDIDKDPVGHLMARLQRHEALLGETVTALAGQARQEEQNAGVTALRNRAAALERDYATTTPDYDKAAQHLFDARRAELAAAGWSDPGEIQAMLVNEATGLAARAMQQNRNPGEVVYALAKLRGYQPSAQNDAPNGEQQVRTIERGQQQSRSVGNLRGGSAPPVALSAQRLADMKEEEFAVLLAKATPDQMREMFGS